jgi:hypothetical protein
LGSRGDAQRGDADMNKERTVTQKYVECDGCKYVMGNGPMITVSVPFDFPFEWLRGAKGETLDFHFHAIQARHDCFRYWAHNPGVMRDSLRARELDNEQIDEFMSLMLYRQNSYSPGIEKPKVKA